MARPNRGPRLERNDRGVYEIRWSEDGRTKRVSTRESDPAEAAAVFAEWRRGVEREKASATATDCRALLAAYFTEHVYRKVIGQGTAEVCRRHLLAHFGGIAPADIRPADARDFARLRAAGRIGRAAGGATVRRELGVLVAALNHAVREGRLKRADVPAIPLPEASPPRDRWLTEGEVARLQAAALGEDIGQPLSRAYRFVMIAYYTAARKRAIETLKWDQVDFEGNTIHLLPRGAKRTKKRRPSVHMHPRLRAMMERAHEVRTSEYVLDHGGSARKTFETAVRVAGLADVTPHVLRHTAATHMLRRGVPLWQVAGVLGDTEKTVQDTYGKHVPEALKEAVEALL